MDNEWIKELKVGDEVIVESGGWSHIRSIKKVQKINKVTIKVGGSLFSINSGCERGEGWHMGTLYQCTPQAKEEIRLAREKNEFVAYLLGFNWRTLENEKLRKIYNIIKEDKQ